MLSEFLLSSALLAAVPFRFGVSGHMFRDRTPDDVLEILAKTGVRDLCVTDFHLRCDSDDAAIAAFKAKCAAAGVVPYAVGPFRTESADRLRPCFEFAKRLGVKTVVGVPCGPADERDDWNGLRVSRRLLEEADRLVKEFDIRYAVLDPGDASPGLFPDGACGRDLLKDLDPRIGFCLDVDRERGRGHDPVRTVRELGDRIRDVRVGDLGTGKTDYVKVFAALAETGYDGVCALERETPPGDGLVAVAGSIGYARGVCDAIRVKAKPDPVPAGANTLTAEERAEGFELLFDGRNLPTDVFVGVKDGFRSFPAKGWFVEDGCLTMRPVNGITPDGRWFPLPPEDQKLGGGGDIVTKRRYRDFVFKFDFRLTEAANSGVKYFFDETQNGASSEEYQILEDGHPDSSKGRNGNRRVASLYDIFPADVGTVAKGAGRWQHGMIVAKDGKVEHWLNGVKVLEYERASKAFADGVRASKYATWGKDRDGGAQPWGLVPEGRLLLQDHSDSTVSFCNLKARAL